MIIINSNMSSPSTHTLNILPSAALLVGRWPARAQNSM
jgi:hypothetical protein